MIQEPRNSTLVTVMLEVYNKDIPKDGSAANWVESQMGWLDLDGIRFMEVIAELEIQGKYDKS